MIMIVLLWCFCPAVEGAANQDERFSVNAAVSTKPVLNEGEGGG